MSEIQGNWAPNKIRGRNDALGLVKISKQKLESAKMPDEAKEAILQALDQYELELRSMGTDANLARIDAISEQLTETEANLDNLQEGGIGFFSRIRNFFR